MRHVSALKRARRVADITRQLAAIVEVTMEYLARRYTRCIIIARARSRRIVPPAEPRRRLTEPPARTRPPPRRAGRAAGTGAGTGPGPAAVPGGGATGTLPQTTRSEKWPTGRRRYTR